MNGTKIGRKKLLLTLVPLALCAGALVLGISAYVVLSADARVLSPEAEGPEDLDCVLVLGCGIRPDGSPTPMLYDRITRSVALYQAGWADKLLMTGDNSRKDYNEVGTMKAVAMAQGVPEEDIVLDHAGFSTYDSLYRARDIFGAERLVIVTQEYHLSRALFLAEALDLEAWGVPANLREYPGQLGRDLREIAARNKDVLWAILQPQPKFLGEPIPLDGTTE